MAGFAETAGRIMRAQAERKQVFQTIQPILTDGFIRPKEEHRPAAKNRKSIKEAITELQKSLEDDDTGFVTMQNVVEHDGFPATYEELQPLPRLMVGLLTYAGDDGGAKGQAYRFSLDQETGTAMLLFRFPDDQGLWCWRKTPTVIGKGLLSGLDAFGFPAVVVFERDLFTAVWIANDCS